MGGIYYLIQPYDYLSVAVDDLWEWIKMLDYADYIKIFIGLLAIVNPFGAIPLFISITADQNEKQHKQTINLVAISVAIILLVTLFFGELLLRFFGITIDSFRVGVAYWFYWWRFRCYMLKQVY